MPQVPKYSEFFSPVLRVLSRDSGGVRRQQVKDLASTEAGLTDEHKRIPMPSGRGLVYESRIGWALTYLKYAGLADTPARGVWRLTDEGQKLLAKYPKGLPKEEVLRIDSGVRRLARETWQRNREGSDGEVAGDVQGGSGPEETIQAAIRDLESKVISELLSEISRITDYRFELLVLDVLRGMGYAWDEAGVQHTGRSGDGGIDGVIDMDPLGIQKVYVQAKKWAGNVGRKEIQAFVGSLAGFQARMGVFITSSEFTREAREYSKITSDKVVLVDGQKLARLMIQHSVGVTPKAVNIPTLDSDYFEEA